MSLGSLTKPLPIAYSASHGKRFWFSFDVPSNRGLLAYHVEVLVQPSSHADAVRRAQLDPGTVWSIEFSRSLAHKPLLNTDHGPLRLQHSSDRPEWVEGTTVPTARVLATIVAGLRDIEKRAGTPDYLLYAAIGEKRPRLYERLVKRAYPHAKLRVQTIWAEYVWAL